MTKKASMFGWIVCGLGALFYCYEYFLRVAPSVMTQELSQSFNISAAALGNLVAVYYYIYTPMQLPAGLLMDRFGPRRLLAIASLVCALGSILFAAGGLHLAMLGRLMVGFGSAFAFVGTLRLAVSWLPPSRFAMVTGSVTTLGMLGAMGSDILIGRMLHTFSWQKITFISAIAGFLIAAFIWIIIPEKKDKADVSVEQHTAVTFNQLFKEFIQLIKMRQLWLVGLVGCLFYLPISVFAELWGIPYLKQAHAFSNEAASRVISMIFLGEVFGGPLIGWIADRLNNRTLPIIVSSALAVVLISIVLYVPGLTVSSLCLLFFVIGMLCTGQNLVFPLACRMTEPRFAGTAMAITNMLVMLGGVVFQPVIGMFLEIFSGKHVKGDLSVYSGADFQSALIILPLALIITFIVMFFIRDNKDIKIAADIALTDSDKKATALS